MLQFFFFKNNCVSENLILYNQSQVFERCDGYQHGCYYFLCNSWLGTLSGELVAHKSFLENKLAYLNSKHVLTYNLVRYLLGFFCFIIEFSL